MSKQFQERFRNRSSLMPSAGLTKLALGTSVNISAKPLNSDRSSKSGLSSITPPKLKNLTPDSIYIPSSQSHPVKVILKPEKSIIKKQLLQNKSASPTQKNVKNFNSNEERLNFTYSTSEYRPYTIKDYRMIKPIMYLKLGGLGPTHVGCGDWKVKKGLYEKRLEYGKKVYTENAANLPVGEKYFRMKESTGSRKRAIEFAKTIVKPPLKLPLYSYR